MHRSGTSLITALLQSLGAHLGPPEHMMKPQPDNPRGFYEHQLLNDIDEEILARLGGTWSEPPVWRELGDGTALETCDNGREPSFSRTSARRHFGAGRIRARA
jgi:hypothetical protein